MKKLLLLTLALVAFTACNDDEKKTPSIKVTSISLNETTQTIIRGNSFQLTVTEVLPANATNKKVTWSSSNRTAAIVDQTGLVTIPTSAAADATAIITATAKDGSGETATCDITVDGGIFIADGASINGIVWASCNVGAPGVFVGSQENRGMLYQWNRKTAWLPSGQYPVSSPMGTAWSKVPATSPNNIWQPANDPCPTGWRVPTSNEQRALCNEEEVIIEWTTVNDIKGYRFTDRTYGGTIFLPVTSYRDSETGVIGGGLGGQYWSNILSTDTQGRYLNFSSTVVYPQGEANSASGFVVRCVAI